MVTKLYMSYAAAIIFAFVIGVIGIVAVITTVEQGNRALDEVYLPMFYTEQVTFEYSDFFYFSKDASSTDDVERIEEDYEGTIIALDKMLNNIYSYIDFLGEGEYIGFDDYTQSEEYQILVQLKDIFENIKPAVDTFFDLCINDPEAALEYYDVYIDEPTEDTDAIFERLAEISAEYTELQKTTQKEFEAWIKVVLILAVLAVIILLVVVSLYMTSYIKKSINKMVEATENVAQGRLNVNLDTSRKDEFGILSGNLQKVIMTLENLIRDLNIMAEKHKEGDTDHFINADDYSGSYGVVAAGVNEMVIAYQDDIDAVLNSITKFAEGDFDVVVKDFPGKKAVYKEIIEDIGKILKNINEEIRVLVQKASNGIFDERANEEGFSFGWKEVISNLNELLNQVSMPLEEISSALNEMSEGNFSVRVTGEYEGSFKMAKDALNEMADSISAYIEEISEVLECISDGKLNRTINSDYVGDFSAIKASVNNIVSGLSETIGNMNASSEHTAAGARQMSDSSNLIAQGATDQSLSVDSLNNLMESLNQKNQDNTQNTSTARDASVKALENSDEGTRNMNELLESMEEIKTASDNISSIIKVIEDVSFQTNLLSLNASVEAARAGEHGKGFAVVAEEVRTLAHRSQEAAKDSAALINTAVEKANAGMEIATITNDTLAKIVSDVQAVSKIIDSISLSTEEQSKELEEANIQLRKILEITTNNVAVSEESAATAEELSSQSEMLREMVNRFEL
ncbi:methyl-accepting chemotaxis protein [Tyzzerella sp. OttesenSCG-928-J15]|nr:methyl-accepting chemotaxis protein [Tyzzerella sp. OttesenSCG-928-J15]